MKRNVLNKILLLRLVYLSNEISSYRKIPQMVFILQTEGRKEKRTTFNYEFKKWYSEPYSMELEKDLQQLDREALLRKNEYVELTKKGLQLLQKTEDFFKQENIDVFFKFFSYLHTSETFYETCTHINEKYEIAKFETDEVISSLERNEEPEKKEKEDKISKKYEELETSELDYIEDVQRLFSNEVRKDGVRK